MDPSDPNLKLEKKVLNVSFAGSVVFLVAEIIVAIWTKSAAVLMDCVFDIADLIMIGPFMVLIPLLYKPVTENKPYGYSQVESLFVMIKTGILIGVTTYLVVSSVRTIISGGVRAGCVRILRHRVFHPYPYKQKIFFALHQG